MLCNKYIIRRKKVERVFCVVLKKKMNIVVSFDRAKLKRKRRLIYFKKKKAEEEKNGWRRYDFEGLYVWSA